MIFLLEYSSVLCAASDGGAVPEFGVQTPNSKRAGAAGLAASVVDLSI